MAAFDRREPDRVPVVPFSRSFNIRYAGYRFGDIVRDPDRYTGAAVRAQRALGFDAVDDMWNSGLFAEAFGAAVVIHEDDPPTVNATIQETALARADDVERIPAGEEFMRHPRIHYALRMLSHLRKGLDPEIPLGALVPSPFLMAGSLRNIQAFMMDLIDDPELVARLMERCTVNCLAYARAALEAGGDYVITVNPFASASCISRQDYLAFNHPYAKRFFQGMRAAGIRVMYHICGDWTDRLDLVVEEGPHVCYLDKVDLGLAKRLYGGRVALMGNVRTVETLLQGTPAEVREESLQCMQKAADGGGFILSGDCVLPRDTPPENLAAMIEAARAHGRYPLSLPDA